MYNLEKVVKVEWRDLNDVNIQAVAETMREVPRRLCSLRMEPGNSNI